MAQVAIVTGGAGGIGSEICTALAQDGFQVAVADFNDEAAGQLSDRLKKEGKEALSVKVDVGDEASVAGMTQKVLERYGKIDLLLNGAGIMPRHPVLEISEEEWDRVLRINLKGTFLCSRAAAAHMVGRKEGRIINVASGRGVAGAPNAAHYAASKAGVIAFTKTLAKELAPHNIIVNAIAPGRTDTPMARAGSTDEQWKESETISPLMGGLTKKEEIVGLIRYLLSDSSRFITGQLFLLRTPT
ncbi:MAG: SDR family NAD(P)-dependent oxidoreductase [Candidatus Binatia bacterium]|nr:SDR family NAD(P)-dependent oxidoreductase [Candidatus Binatia bacterium]